MKILFIALASLALHAAPAAAQEAKAPGVFKTGEQLYQACISDVASDVKACDWFLMGAHDMAAMARDLGWIDRDNFCMPRDVDVVRLRALAVELWRDNADSRRYSAVSATLNAITAAYPGACKSDQ